MRPLALALTLAAAGCARKGTPPMPSSPPPTPVLTDPGQLDGHVGQVVTLRGAVTRTKIPTLLGVDVDGEDLAGQPAEATGVLERTVVTRAEIDAQIARFGQFANRGPGTFYHLRALDGAGLAKPRRAPD